MNQKEKITILHICDFAAKYPGNFIALLKSLETYHSNIKNVYLFPPRANNRETKNWIDEMNSQEEIAYIQKESFLNNVLLFRQIIKKHKVDRIVRHFADIRIDVVLKFLYNGKKVVRFFHGDYVKRNRVKHNIKKFLWKHNQFAGVSDTIAKEVQRAFPKASVSSIVNAVHFARLEDTEPITKPNGISLLMMGRDCEVKGVDLAIKAVWSLQEQYNLMLQVVALDNEDNVKKLARQIVGEDPGWIRYLPSTNNIGTYYSANDIFLSPSRREAFGFANIEAAYCKNSIVLSRVGGQGELQIEGAYWFESENLEDFKKQLELAILEVNTPEKIAQRERVKEQVQKTYSLQQWSNKVVDLLK